MTDLNRRMAAGAAWMIVFRAATRGLGFISTVILARLLQPSDFGLVALATAMIGALELMTMFSFDVALIQRRDSGRAQYDTAWTITVLFASVTAAALAAFARPAAAFYGDPRLAPIMYVLACGTLAEGFENIGVVAFRKDMDFRRDFLFQIGKKSAAFLTTVPLAFWLRSYWALVAGLLAGKVMGTLLSYRVNAYRPRFSFAAWGELFGFSRWLFLNNLLWFVRHRFADFVVGKVAGPGPLGLFSVSYELAHLPTNELVAPINRAVFPAYAQISSDAERLRQSYLDVVSMIAFFAIPAAAGITVLAEPLVAAVLGPRWMDAVPLIRILGAAGVISALETNIGAAYLALGRPEILTRLYGFYGVVFVVLLLVLTPGGGARGAAWASLITAVLNVPVYFGAMLATLDLPLRRFLAVIWRPVSAAAVMYGAVAAAEAALVSTGIDVAGVAAVALLLSGVLIGLVTYGLATLALWALAGRPAASPERVLLDRAREQWRRRFPREAQVAGPGERS